MSNRPNRQNVSSEKVKAAAAGGRSSLLWLWVGLAVVVVAVIVGAIIIGSSSSSDSDGGSASPNGGTVVPNGNEVYGETVTVQGAALPEDGAGSTSDPAIGKTLPTIAGTTFDGSPITIGPDGKPKLIFVVAHWCPHCQAEVPKIQKWLDDNGMPADVELVTVATSNDPPKGNSPAGKWLRQEGWSVPTMLDDDSNDAGAALGVKSFPYFVAVDAEGKVVFRGSGELTIDQIEMLVDSARTGDAPI